MKTNDKPHFPQPKGGAPGGPRNKSNRGHGKRKDTFFREVTRSETNSFQQQRNDKRGGVDRPSGKHGPGIRKTVAFKPNHDKRPGKEGKHPGNGNRQNKGRPQTSKQQNGYKKQRSSVPPKPAATEIRFESKPEKVNYCLAPERLEAQSRAVKQFERQEREQEFERKKQDRQQKHKMMTQKTRKGQPVMQGRLELLYEKVKKVVGVQ
uniref:rRNA-processing protein FYV7 n=1 Tax=Anopheles culicifacies TaxID=139723 RepID=A0A182MM73_9DIPT